MRALTQLGQALFNDTRLSADSTISCASCHVPEHHFTDGRSTARGLHGRMLTRRTPSLLNVRFAGSLFWDGRATDLEAQARSPLLGPSEHGLPSEQAVAAIVNTVPSYAAAFRRLLGVPNGTAISFREVTQALAAYERTLTAGDSLFDRYEYGHDRQALTPAAIRGLMLFRGRAQCATCHLIGASDAMLTDGDFHSSPLQIPTTTLGQLGSLTTRVKALSADGRSDAVGALIVSDPDVAALGRFVVTVDPKDIGLFKTPSLRNVALNGPYMHDGSVATLAEAVNLELYSRVKLNYPLVLTEREGADLLEFLRALSSP